VREYQYSQSHEETDDAQIAADISPVISKISGYIAEVKVKDNQFVKKGDTLVVLDNRDQTMALEQAEAALGTAQSNVASAQAGSEAAKTESEIQERQFKPQMLKSKRLKSMSGEPSRI
jgi:membrane fusion protein (multidrug efflux system)